MAYNGIFRPSNPSKYTGDPGNIIYRSRWELMVMGHLDKHPDVLKWGSEEIIIPYRSPIDGKVHRYFPDFYCMKRNASDGKVVECLIEVKPKAQTRPPAVMEAKSKPTRRYIHEVKTWGINSAKWKAAESYCKDRNWQFMIITEDDLGLKF